MLLAIDIGNSRVKFGGFDGGKLIVRASIPTEDLRRGIAELPTVFTGWDIEAVIVSSVVPEVNMALSGITGAEMMFVDHAFDLGLIVKYDPPTAAGIDRLVAAAAAVAKYGKPCIICDFGTATTIDAVNSQGEYLGGTITPGINTLSKALFSNTSKLPEIPVRKPENVIGGSTKGSIESGVFYGYIGLVEGILRRVKNELAEDAKVIATGGFVELISPEIALVDVVDRDLILEGLRIIYSKNRGILPQNL